jgi:hypothetical protein
MMDEPTKREQMAALVKKREECNKIALEIVFRLIEPNVHVEYLLNKVSKEISRAPKTSGF